MDYSTVTEVICFLCWLSTNVENKPYSRGREFCFLPNSIGINSLLGESPKNVAFDNKLLDYFFSNLMVQAVHSEVRGSFARMGAVPEHMSHGRGAGFGQAPSGGFRAQAGHGRKLGEPLQSLGEGPGIARSWNSGAEGKWKAPEHVLNILMYLLPEPFGPPSYEHLLCKPISSCDFLRACGKIAGHGVNKLNELLMSMGRMHRQAVQPALPAPPATGTHGGGLVPRRTWVIRGISTHGYTYVLNPSPETIKLTQK